MQIEADAQIQAGNSADPAPPVVTPQIIQEGSEVVVRGGNGDDYFRFEAGAALHTITLNEETRQFPAAEVTSIRFDGGLGIDTVELIGISAQDQVDLAPKTATFQGAGYTVVVTASENILIRSTGPGDEVRWSDSPVPMCWTTFWNNRAPGCPVGCKQGQGWHQEKCDTFRDISC